jgi:hypothetical protein
MGLISTPLEFQLPLTIDNSLLIYKIKKRVIYSLEQPSPCCRELYLTITDCHCKIKLPEILFLIIFFAVS